MATYNHEQKALFIGREIAESIVEDEKPLVSLHIEYMKNGDVSRSEMMHYYVIGDDMVVISDSDDEYMAFISGRTAYGTGEYTVRKDISNLVETERRHGSGLDMRISAEKASFDLGIQLPTVVERG